MIKTFNTKNYYVLQCDKSILMIDYNNFVKT